MIKYSYRMSRVIPAPSLVRQLPPKYSNNPFRSPRFLGPHPLVALSKLCACDLVVARNVCYDKWNTPRHAAPGRVASRPPFLQRGWGCGWGEWQRGRGAEGRPGEEMRRPLWLVAPARRGAPLHLGPCDTVALRAPLSGRGEKSTHPRGAPSSGRPSLTSGCRELTLLLRGQII